MSPTADPLPEQPAVLERIARMCLALPDATAKLSHGAPCYQVRGKTFAYTWNDHHGSGRLELWVKGKPGAQQEWLAADRDKYYRPAYVGSAGWVGAWLDVAVDWPAIGELLVDGYLDRVGPRVAATLEPTELISRLDPE